ncbi:Peptidyl-prolyl isomerase cwc27 [Dimargaris xerosporica]|nr:Peptidyl-prolyl isomerase cwc27 [Dimargaris xerosporica]
MSSIYIQEPPTRGHIVLETTKGTIEVALWTKEAPLACRNFVQLCLEGYYDDTIFHRVVPGFIVQGGDPTGTGEGGASVYDGGEPFKDEFHSRLRFVRRGLLAMANAGPNDNGSQFFFTLDRTDELQRKHTIFGTAIGDSVFTVLKIGELETDDQERPRYPPKILSTTVVENPFPDIVPRVTAEERQQQKTRHDNTPDSHPTTRNKRARQSKRKGVKNRNLLSFGDDAEDAEKDGMNPFAPTKGQNKGFKMQSLHDVVQDDSRISQHTAADAKSATHIPVLTQTLKPSDRNAIPSAPKEIAINEPATADSSVASSNATVPGASGTNPLTDAQSLAGKRISAKSSAPAYGDLMQGYTRQRDRSKSKRPAGHEDKLFAKLNAFKSTLTQVTRASKYMQTETSSLESQTLPKDTDASEYLQSAPRSVGAPLPPTASKPQTTSDATTADASWLAHRLQFASPVTGNTASERDEDGLVTIDPLASYSKVITTTKRVHPR